MKKILLRTLSVLLAMTLLSGCIVDPWWDDDEGYHHHRGRGGWHDEGRGGWHDDGRWRR